MNRHARKGLPHENRRLLMDVNLQIIFGITVMAIVGVFTIAPAMPRIVEDLQISASQVGLLITIFSLPGIFLMPLMGIGADFFGRKNVLGLCLLLFGLAGGACFFVRDFHLLLVLRFFQGVGAAPLSSLNIACISDLYSGNTRTTAMGYNQAILSIGAAVLTAVGGALATLGAFYPFLLALIGIPIGVLVLFKLKGPKHVKPPVFSLYFLEAIKTIKNPRIITIYLVTIGGLVMVWGSYISYFPILMGTKLQQTPSVIGLIMTSMMICSAIASAQIGRLSGRFSGKNLFKLSFACYGSALLTIPFISMPWLMLAPICLFGVGHGIFILTVQDYLSKLSCPENRGVVMALYGSAIRIGQTLGPFLAGLVFPIVGIDGLFFLCAGLAFVLIGIVATRIDQPVRKELCSKHRSSLS